MRFLFSMNPISNKGLLLASGPKDIGRFHLIRAIVEELALKECSYYIHRNEIETNRMTDHNILIFDETVLNDHQVEQIKSWVNVSSIYIFGRLHDDRLHRLIPAAESFYRWKSVCEYCKEVAAFEYEGVICCRQCRNKCIMKSCSKRAGSKRTLDFQEQTNHETNENMVTDDTSNKKRRLNSDSSSVIVVSDTTSNKSFDSEPPTMTTLPLADATNAWGSPINA